MKTTSTIFMIILCTVFAGGQVFAESGRGGSSIDKAHTSVKSVERTGKHSVNQVEQDDQSPRRSERTNQKVRSAKKNGQAVTSATGTVKNTVKDDGRSTKERARSVKHNVPTTEKQHAVKHDARSVKQEVISVKGSNHSAKHSDRSVKHGVAPSKHDNRGIHHDGHGDKQYDHHSHSYRVSAPARVIHSTTVVNTCVSSIVVKPQRTVIVRQSVIVEKPYYVNAWLDDIVVVIVSELNVRSGPGGAFVVIDQVYQGESLVVYGWEISSDWLYVELPSGRFGWVLAEYTSSVFPYSCG